MDLFYLMFAGVSKICIEVNLSTELATAMKRAPRCSKNARMEMKRIALYFI